MEKLKHILELTIELLMKSEASDWSPLNPEQVIDNLKSQIKKIKEGKELDMDLLKLEFASTSTIQEISMSNGWSDEYLVIASNFDTVIKQN